MILTNFKEILLILSEIFGLTLLGVPSEYEINNRITCCLVYGIMKIQQCLIS